MRAMVGFLGLILGTVGAACGDDGAEETVEDVHIDNEGTEPEIESVPGVDVSRLSRGDQRTFFRLVNDLLSPCGEPVSVARCVVDERSCGRCLPAARYIGRLVGEGLDRAEVRELYRSRFDEESRHAIDVEGAPTRGAVMGADVTIVEFSDFECPYCRLAAPILERVAREHSDRVSFVFKHYPLGGHEHSRPAARAAIAAGRQGKFWEMHDLLFEHQHALEPSDLEGYARRLGLDLERFRTDMEASETEALIDANRAEGREVGVDGTPRIFVNGRPFEESFENMDTYVREELRMIDQERH